MSPWRRDCPLVAVDEKLLQRELMGPHVSAAVEIRLYAFLGMELRDV